MRVEEKTVVSPGEGPGSPVQEVESRGLRELSAVLMLDVLDVSGVFGLSVVDPGAADSDWQFPLRLRSWRKMFTRRTARNSDIVAVRNAAVSHIAKRTVPAHT